MKIVLKKLVFLLMLLSFTSVFCMGIYASAANNTSHASTCYTALGDSIAYGYKVPQENSNVTLFYNYLKTKQEYSAMELYNMSQNGDDSSDVLRKLKGDKNIIDAVKKSDIITICIGANNILSPVIDQIGKSAGLDTSSPDFLEKLEGMIKQNPAGTMTIASALKPDVLSAGLIDGITKFSKDWPEIIGIVEKLAPQAEIYVMNVYNPLSKSDVLYSSIDSAIQQVNNIINKPNPYYMTADVYTAFREYKGTSPLTSFNILQGSLDPHPSIQGHNIIYDLYCQSYELRAKQSLQTVKRADAVSILISALGLKKDFEDNFSDVKKESSYYNSIGIAKKFGIVAGKGQNMFYPDAEITREEAVAIVDRAMIAAGKNLPRGSEADISVFEDISAVSSFAIGNIATLYKGGIVSFNGNKIAPKDKISYYDFMNMLYSIL